MNSCVQRIFQSGTYIQQLLQTFKGLRYFVDVIWVMLILGLKTHQSYGKQRWLQKKKKAGVLVNQACLRKVPEKFLLFKIGTLQ